MLVKSKKEPYKGLDKDLPIQRIYKKAYKGKKGCCQNACKCKERRRREC